MGGMEGMDAWDDHPPDPPMMPSSPSIPIFIRIAICFSHLFEHRPDCIGTDLEDWSTFPHAWCFSTAFCKGQSHMYFLSYQMNAWTRLFRQFVNACAIRRI